MDAEPVVIRPASIPGQVADFLRQAISHGDHEPGATLPSERAMAERYQVSIATIRQALAMLVADGLVIKVNGKGTIVRGKPGPAQIITRTAVDPWAEMTPVGKPHPYRVPAKPSAASMFDIDEGSILFVIDQAATHATGQAVLTRRTLPNHAFDGMKDYPDPFGPRDQIVEALKHHHGSLRSNDQVRPLMPDPDERDALKLDAGDLLIEVTRITRSPNGRAILAESQRYGEGVVLEYVLDSR
jgi:GntR family transcriptional regulator